MLIENKWKNEQWKCWLFIGLFAIGTIITMSRPITLNNDIQFDFFYEIFLIGSLYYRIPAIIVLSVTAIITRFLLDDGGIYSTVLFTSFFATISFIIYPKFLNASKQRKIGIGIIYSIFCSLIMLAVDYAFFDNSTTFYNSLIYIIAKVIIVAIIIYHIEYVRESSLIKHRVLKAEKMEVVSQLASSISHEVRNPLTVVRGFLQMMLNIELEKEKKQEYLNLAISEIDRANQIIRNYLSFAKPDLENLDIISISEEVERIKEIITPLANMNCVKIHMNIQSGFVKGISPLFQQCLLNITKNCIEAMPDGGILTIESNTCGHYLYMKITDTGCGMSEEQIARIGEPFFSTKGENGTGLGMMAAVQIIERMNGKLNIKSTVDIGTEFLIVFPSVSPENTEFFPINFEKGLSEK